MTHHTIDLLTALLLCSFGFSALMTVLDSDGQRGWTFNLGAAAMALASWWLAFCLMHFAP